MAGRPVVMLVVADATGRPVEEWLRSYDPHTEDGAGAWELTPHRSQARVFEGGMVEAMSLWQTINRHKPRRLDGKPNRPLTRFTVECVPA